MHHGWMPIMGRDQLCKCAAKPIWHRSRSLINKSRKAWTSPIQAALLQHNEYDEGKYFSRKFGETVDNVDTSRFHVSDSVGSCSAAM